MRLRWDALSGFCHCEVLTVGRKIGVSVGVGLSLFLENLNQVSVLFLLC